jgi:hypothetical protein
METRGIIYLVQPSELIGTDHYKIGCSTNTDLEIISNFYKKDTSYLSIMECKNPFELKKKIKCIFNEKFSLIAGNDFFKGDELEILDEFINIVKKHNKNLL